MIRVVSDRLVEDKGSAYEKLYVEATFTHNFCLHLSASPSKL